MAGSMSDDAMLIETLDKVGEGCALIYQKPTRVGGREDKYFLQDSSESNDAYYLQGIVSYLEWL